MKKFLQNRSNRIFLIIFLFGFFLRFYRLESLTTFGGDQGKDYLNVARMIINNKLTLLGPITHVGIYLGPLYYYLLLPVFYIFNFDPIAAPFLFATFGSATIIVFYYLAKNFLKTPLALLSTLLYAISPIIIESSRAPSQPHLIPFFSSILLLSLVRVLNKKSNKIDAIIIGVSLASVIQFHFLTFPLFIVSFGVLLFAQKNKLIISSFYAWTLLPLIILLLPWVLFELRHEFFISNQIVNYLSSGEISFSLIELLTRAVKLAWFTISRLAGQENILVSIFVSLISILGIIKSSKNKQTILLFSYTILNLLGISLYFNPFDNHYISALYPAILLFIAIGFKSVSKPTIGKIVFLGLILFNLFHYQPFRNNGYTMPDNLNQKTIKNITALIAKDNPPANFQVAATLDGDTRAMPYRYLLEAKYSKIPLGVEEYPLAGVLYVITRNQAEKTLTNPVWEISSLPNKTISRTWIIQDNIYLHKILRNQ